ncbi:hypothetical protein ACFOEY_03480 [Paracandidimonas soli]
MKRNTQYKLNPGYAAGRRRAWSRRKRASPAMAFRADRSAAHACRA